MYRGLKTDKFHEKSPEYLPIVNQYNIIRQRAQKYLKIHQKWQ